MGKEREAEGRVTGEEATASVPAWPELQYWQKEREDSTDVRGRENSGAK